MRQLVGHTVAEVMCELIIETLANQRGSRTEAAKLLDFDPHPAKQEFTNPMGVGNQCLNQVFIE